MPGHATATLLCQRPSTNDRPRIRPLHWDKLFHHRLMHEVRRQQALRQNEIMETLLLELGPKRRFGFLA
jgi:hypothetical protein